MNYAIGIILILIVGALLFFQWQVARRARNAVGQPVGDLDPVIDAKLRERGKVLLYFFSPNCGPCRAMTPVISRLAGIHDNVFKLDVSQSLNLARTLGVMATPTILLLTNGRIASVHLGGMSEKNIETLLA